MTDQAAKAVEAPDHKPDVPPWLRATMADVKTVDFEAPITGSVTADCDELADRFRSLLQPQEEGVELTDDPTARVFNLLSSLLGMHFKPEQKNEPFGPMVTFADGRRSAIPEDFRKAHVDVLAYMADRAMNPVLRARLCDISWLLDRKRGVLGTRAISSYVEIVRKSDAGELKWRFPEENEDGGLQHEAPTHLRRALQIGRSIGWDKAETVAARLLVAELRKRANGAGTSVPVHWFSRLDLDFGVSDPAEVAAGIDDILKALQGHENMHALADLWRLAARGYHLAKKDDDAYRCKAAAAECLVAEAENTHSALVASHHLSAAIAELHGIPGKKERRTELRHRLIDVQAGISEEMSVFSREVDLREIVENVEKEIKKHGLLDKLLAFATLAHSPDPDDLVREAIASIREHPLASLLGASHLDREGKVVHRTEGGLFGETGNDSVVRAQITQSEGIRRRLIAFGQIDPARRAIMDEHYLSDDVFASLLQYSPFVPADLLDTFARGFAQFFRGDFVSATYILTPLLENSLRHVLKAHGHDVTIFDDASQTQQDRTISSLFEQMRAELDGIFTKAITADVENVFLTKPGPYLRHSLAHGLLHDGDPYGPDAIYGCWLIIRLCLIPLMPIRDRLLAALDVA